MVKKLAAVALGATLIVAATGGIAGAQGKCEGAKEKATGKLAGGILKCQGKNASKALTTDCNAANDPKLAASFSKAESKPPCATTGDAGSITTQTHTFAASIVSALWVDSPTADKCAGSKIGAASKKASGLLGCQAKAAAKSLPLDPACVSKVTGKFSAAFAKAESKPPCATTGDEGTIETDVDNYVASIVAALQPPPPTTTTSTTHAPTTTSTTTSTTTTTTACSCCPGAGSLIKFTNGIGAGNCGTVTDSTNTLNFNLACGGLYTGAGAATLSNPGAPPDMGTEYVKPSACSGSTYTILPTVPADLAAVVASNPQRNCTSAGVADPDYPACAGGTNVGKPCVSNADCPSSTCSSTMPGCLFGAPLALPNPGFAGASVCIVNRISTSASGTGNCSTGSTNLNLPLASDLYLTGDLLDGSAPDRPNVPGINPCPICDTGTHLCQGGPRHGLACHPDTSVLSAAYPTSHDCPPPPGPLGGNYIGALPIHFNLSTGNQTMTSLLPSDVTNHSGQELFCGFCAAPLGQNFHNPAVSCTHDSDCTGVTGCPGTAACSRCKQRDSGFCGTSVPSNPNPGDEHVISVTGSSAGACLADAAPHAATLVSAFCIPPAFNATVDANGDIPGPGVVSLPGMSQLIP
jgi:hypothetical protein